MEIKSPMELATEALSYNNQNIASEAIELQSSNLGASLVMF